MKHSLAEAPPVTSPLTYHFNTGIPHRHQDSDPTIVLKKSEARKGVSVLVIDDNPVQLRTLQAILDKSGYRVFTAGSAQFGYELMRNTHIDIIVCDLVMPEMNGIAFLNKVRSLRTFPREAHIPIVIVSATDPDRRTRTLLGSADLFLEKVEIPGVLIKQLDSLANIPEFLVD